MNRNDEKRKALCIFKGWKFRMFEGLLITNTKFGYDIDDLSLKKSLSTETLVKFNEIVPEITQLAIESFNYNTVVNSYKEIIDYKHVISKELSENTEIIRIFREKITEKLLIESEKMDKTWIVNVFSDKKILEEATSARNALSSFIQQKFLLEYTKVLLKIEQECGIFSLTNLHRHSIFSCLWNENFKSLNTDTVQVQLQYESNSLPKLKLFTIPFIEREFYIIKKLFKESFISFDFDSQPDEFTLASFKSSHLAKSCFNIFTENFYKHQDLQFVMLEDFSKILLTEAMCKFNHLNVIHRLLMYVIKANAFEKQIINYFKISNKVVILHKVLEMYVRCTGLETDWMIDLIYFFETFDELPDPKTIMLEICMKIIEDVLPSAEILSRCENTYQYLVMIEGINEAIQELAGNFIENVLDFNRIELAIQMCRVNLNDKILISWSNTLVGRTGAGYNEKFIKRAIIELKELRYETHDETQSIKINKLVVYFYLQYINLTHKCLRTLARDINKYSVWRYSRILLDSIIDKSGITELIENHEKELIQTDDFLESNNCYLIELISVINASKVDSNFNILVSDRICNFLKPTSDLLELKKTLSLSVFYASILQNNKSLSYNLIAASRLRQFLEYFSEILLIDDNVRSSEQIDFIREFSQTILPKNLIFELFLFKSLKCKLNCRVPELLHFLIRSNGAWSHQVNNTNKADSANVIPYIAINNDDYVMMISNIDNVINDINCLDLLLTNGTSINFKLLFSMSIMNRVFLKYKISSLNINPYIQWISIKKELIIKSQGFLFYSLLHSLVHNFPQGSILHLTPEKSFQEYIEIQSILLIIIISIAYSAILNPVSVFMPESKWFMTLKQSFCIGAEPDKMFDYLLYISRSYEALKNTTWKTMYYGKYSLGGTYVCSETCDYVYILDNCGGASTIFECPFCHNKIGGTWHKAVERPGHRNLSDTDALVFLQNKIAYYQSTEAKGFKILNSTPMTEVRNLKHRLSFNLLNLIPTSIFYYALVSNLITPDSLGKILEFDGQIPIDCLKNSILQNFRGIYSMINSEEPYMWVLSSISLLPNIIEQFQGQDLNKNYRNAFELAYEEKVLSETILERINSYKHSISSIMNYDELVSLIEEVKQPSIDYMHWQHFRSVRSPSFESMVHSFNFSNRQKDLKMLTEFIKNYELVDQLRGLWPILKFSKLMITKFSFSISRHDATQISMSEVVRDDTLISKAFTKFLEAWGCVQKELTFECKVIEKPKFSLESKLGCFLLENSLNSLGMPLCAALKYLAGIQNNFLKIIRKDIEHQQSFNYPFDSLTHEDIIRLEFDIDEVINSCYLSYPSYLNGKEIVYDFDRIELNISSSFRKAKLIDIEEFQVIQYQYELLNTRGKYSGVISEIRRHIKQEALNEDKLKEIDEIIKRKKVTSESAIFSEVNKWLDKVLYSARHLRDQPETRVSELCIFGSHGSRECFKELYDVKLKNIVSLYEFIELKCYTEVVKRIEQDYLKEINCRNEVKSEIKSMIGRLNSKTNVAILDIENTLKRIVIRMLTAYIDPNFRIKDYLTNESLWSESKVESTEIVAEEFSHAFTLSEVVSLITVFEEINQEEIKKINTSQNLSISQKISRPEVKKQASGKKIKY